MIQDERGSDIRNIVGNITSVHMRCKTRVHRLQQAFDTNTLQWGRDTTQCGHETFQFVGRYRLFGSIAFFDDTTHRAYVDTCSYIYTLLVGKGLSFSGVVYYCE